MSKKYNNIIRKLFLKSKKTFNIMLSSITKIGLIKYIKNSKKTFSMNYIYIKKDTKVEKTIIVDITITSYFIRNNIISAMNLDIS